MSFSQVLNVLGNGTRLDDTITDKQYHSHSPHTTGLNANDEIRIAIQQQDIYTLPSESYLHLEYTVTDEANNAALAGSPCVSGFFANLFAEIRYEINGVEVDSIRNPGIASLMKNAMTFERCSSVVRMAAGYKYDPTTGFTNFAANGADTTIMDVPLHYLLGFAEDYRQILLNVKQELVLKRNPNTLDCVSVAGAKVVIKALTWMVPYVEVSDETRLRLLQIVDKDKPIKLSFRHWELYEYPLLPETTKHTWTVKTSDLDEKPDFVVIGLQTARRGVAAANGTYFDKCHMKDVRVFLNDKYYPYESIDGDDNKVFLMYAAFNGVYNQGDRRLSDPLFFKSALTDGRMMLYPIDCSCAQKTLKTGAIDITVKFQTDGTNIPANTRAYCLLINTVHKKYNPLTGTVVKA